jgi:uncharacterized membrane protein
MLTFHNYISFIGGLIFILYSIAIILFPPKFGSIFYGIRTKWTMRNKVTWHHGQKLFAVSVFMIGLIFSILGGLKIDDGISGYGMFALLITLWALSKFIVHKVLIQKYPPL